MQQVLKLAAAVTAAAASTSPRERSLPHSRSPKAVINRPMGGHYSFIHTTQPVRNERSECNETQTDVSAEQHGRMSAAVAKYAAAASAYFIIHMLWSLPTVRPNIWATGGTELPMPLSAASAQQASSAAAHTSSLMSYEVLPKATPSPSRS